MAFRVRTINGKGRGGDVAAFGDQTFGPTRRLVEGEHDDELGFGVPTPEMVGSDRLHIETLAGPPWPGSWADRKGQGETKLAMLHALNADEWPTERELALQANVHALLDPKTSHDAKVQMLVQQGQTPEQAERILALRARPDGIPLLEGVKPIARRPAPRQRTVPKPEKSEPTSGASSDLSAKEAQAKREAKAAGGDDNAQSAAGGSGKSTTKGRGGRKTQSAAGGSG
jgi:hypothetical protein